tara:strand:+ start:4338 stop:4763 length:426 start_codon:yes stop_codon:yes gene_type:complete
VARAFGAINEDSRRIREQVEDAVLYAALAQGDLPDRGRMTEMHEHRLVAWAPYCGDPAEALVEVEQELRPGPLIRCTRNSRGAGRLNGCNVGVIGGDSSEATPRSSAKKESMKCSTFPASLMAFPGRWVGITHGWDPCQWD